MGLFDNFPYTNFHELNLDWILKVLKDIETTIDQFVSLNIIKYADPIQWDITRQYPKNTIVIDPITGTAYISVDNVPQGVALSNTDYWSVVFDLGRFITLASQNFANSYESVLTTTATIPTDKDHWVVWNSVLYKALNDIHVGDMYVVGGNLEQKTVESFIEDLRAYIIGRLIILQDNIDAEALARSNADITLQDNIDAEALARSNADITLQDNIDAEALARSNADITLQDNIDAEALARNNADITLQDNIDAEALARSNADITLQDNIDATNLKIGDLQNLTTTAKNNIVSAINEVNGQLSGLYDRADIRNYGGVADGSTDNYAAFNACMAENHMVYMPNYNNMPYVFSSGFNITTGQSVIGTEGTTITTSAPLLFNLMGSNIEIKNLIVNTPNIVIQIDSTVGALSFFHIENVYSYGASLFITDNSAAQYAYTNLYVNRCAARLHKGIGINISKCYAFLILEDVTVDYVGTVGQSPAFNITNNYGAHLVRCEAEGGYSDGTHGAHAGFNIDTCQAIWLERCMADTVDSVGFNIRNSQYIYLNSCVSSLNGSHGIALIGSNTSHVIITGCLLAGRRGMASSVPSANGIYNLGICVDISNCNIQNFTGYGYGAQTVANETVITGISIIDCNGSFLQSGGGGLVVGLRSNVNDVPNFGTMIHRACFCYTTLYDSPLGQ